MTPELKEKLRYGSPLHSKLKTALQSRLLMSEKRMSDRYAQMAKNEECFQAYIPEREVDALRRRNREQNGVPEYRTIEIPHSYATIMTAHTYYTSVFLARNPVLQLSGRHGEGEQKRVAIESLMAYQMTVGAMLMHLFVWLLDPGKYGYGVVGHHWDVEKVRMRTHKQVPVTVFGVPIPGKTKIQEDVEDVVGYEGNKLYNVRPQDFFPDTRVALAHFQKGEFCSRYLEVGWDEIYSNSRGEQPRYINYEVLKKMRTDKGTSQGDGGVSRDQGGRTTQLPQEESAEAGYDVPVGFIKSHETYLKLVPSQWGLGKGDEVEIWAFNMSTSGVIFGAEPLGEYHNKFPFDILLDEVDGYSVFPRGMIERVKPMNDVITWLINTHFFNVRASLNNQFIYDPSMVLSKDIENPAPGKMIRLLPQAYGRDVRTILHQMQTVDVTSQHIGRDLGVMIDVISRATGTNDNVMGMINSGGRKTATEVRTSTSFGVNRLKTQCEWFSTIGFGPMTQKLVQRTQQHYSASKKLRLVGDQAQFTQQFLDVTPDLISGFYDFEPVDGTLPIDRFAQANLWQMLMGQLQHYPQIMMQYDIAKIFAWVANLAGIKNVAQFKLVPDGSVNQQVQAGNVVPIGQAMKDAGVPPQLPNVGSA